MDRLTMRTPKGEGTCLQSSNCCCDTMCGWIDDVFNKLADYEDAEEQLETVFGECEGLFEKVVELLVKNGEAELGEKPYKARLLTDEDVDKWEKYKQLEEQGLLLQKPCNVGSHIWVNGVLGCGEAEEYKVIRVDYHNTLGTRRNEFYFEALLVSNPECNSIGFYDKEIGKSVFLSKEEAENHLVS